MSDQIPPFGLVIPTLNAGPWLDQLIPAIRQQTVQPSRIVVMDSRSDDDTVARFLAMGAEVFPVERSAFDHGGTRQLGAQQLGSLPYVVFLTQDALPADSLAFENMLRAFDDGRVGLAYGRQLPRDGAGAIEAQARLFNYPHVSRDDSSETLAARGLKAAFCSNSFSAYRMTALSQAGGFPSGCIFGEDMLVAIIMMKRGWTKSYVAEAQVKHSHAYDWAQDFRRYFDIGAMHEINKADVRILGGLTREGSSFVGSELRYLLKHDWAVIPSAIIRTVLKFVGYKLGGIYKIIPSSLLVSFGMNKSYWKRVVQSRLKPLVVANHYVEDKG